MDCGAQALITGPVGSDVKITISKAETGLNKSAVLTRRGAINTKAAQPIPQPISSPPACALTDSHGPENQMNIVAPTMRPADGHVFPYTATSEAQTISITCQTRNASIRYTLDGILPCANPPMYVQRVCAR